MALTRTTARPGRATTAAPAGGAPPCPGCGHRGAAVDVARVGSVPALANAPGDAERGAESAARAPIRLVRCSSCGIVHNEAFDAALVTYAPGYENALHHSGVFRDFAGGLARDLVARYARRGRVVEIGCGQGDFLRLLLEAGAGSALGFDPSFDAGRAGPPPAGVTIEALAFDAARVDGDPSLVCARHVLEHVPEPLGMLRSIRSSLGPASSAALYVEVPAAEWVLSRRGLWDLVYEHCMHFTGPALAAIVARAGFAVERVRRLYGGQFVAVEGRAAPLGADPVGRLASAAAVAGAEHAAGAARRYDAERRSWASALARRSAAGERCVVWGAGSKGVTFLNLLDRDRRLVSAAVDLNPAKHGRFVSGTGHPITGPDALVGAARHNVIVMNALYRDEIAGWLAAHGARATLLVV